MTWDWASIGKAALEIFKVGSASKQVRDDRKHSEALLAQQLAAETAAKAATDENQRKILESQANVAKMAYQSLTQPGVISSGPAPAPAYVSGASALDGMLPFIILGTVALGAFALLRK